MHNEPAQSGADKERDRRKLELLDRLISADGQLPSQRLSLVEREVAELLERGIEPLVSWKARTLMITLAGIEFSKLPR